MKTKIVKQLLALLGAATLLAGCATPDNRGMGGMANESQTVYGRGSSNAALSGNPFGLATGSGIIQAH
jgi:hypothetical protein